MNFLKIALAAIIISTISACSTQKPGEYSMVNANRFNHVDVPLDIAWQKSIETLNSRWEIISNDTVDKVLVVKTFYHEVEVEFKPLTANTCEYRVYSRDYFIKPNKASVNAVYMELKRALENLQD